MIRTLAIASLLALGTGTAVAADGDRLSPEDRNLKTLLAGAVTSCDAPLVIAGTRDGTLGGDVGVCGDGVETLTLRGAPVHVRFAEGDALEGLACESVYKYIPPGDGPTQYNVRPGGYGVFETSKICIGAESLSLLEAKAER